MQKVEDEKIPEESEHCKDKSCCCSPSSCSGKRQSRARGRLVSALFATAGSGRFAPFTSGYGYSPSSRTVCLSFICNRRFRSLRSLHQRLWIFALFLLWQATKSSARTVCGHKRSKHEHSEALRVLFFLTDLIGHSRHCHLEEKADKVLIGAFGAYRAQGGYIFLAA